MPYFCLHCIKPILLSGLGSTSSRWHLAPAGDVTHAEVPSVIPPGGEERTSASVLPVLSDTIFDNFCFLVVDFGQTLRVTLRFRIHTSMITAIKEIVVVDSSPSMLKIQYWWLYCLRWIHSNCCLFSWVRLLNMGMSWCSSMLRLTIRYGNANW